MTAEGTDRVLTVDANVVNFYHQFGEYQKLPTGLGVCMMGDFCTLLDAQPIAINSFINTEYKQTLGLELMQTWLKLRLRKNLAVEVNPVRLSRKVAISLRESYGFSDAKDSKYLETASNTLCRQLVTENKEHFMRPHRTRGRKSMVRYVKDELGIYICGIDECCKAALGAEVANRRAGEERPEARL